MQIFSRAENESIFGALKCFFESQRARENIKKTSPETEKNAFNLFSPKQCPRERFLLPKKKDIFTLFSRVKLIGSEKERNKQTRRGEAKTKQFYEALNGIENQKLFFMLRN